MNTRLIAVLFLTGVTVVSLLTFMMAMLNFEWVTAGFTGTLTVGSLSLLIWMTEGRI